MLCGEDNALRFASKMTFDLFYTIFVHALGFYAVNEYLSILVLHYLKFLNKIDNLILIS